MLDNIRFDPRLTAMRQIERLGFSPREVRHIVMTHLDFDHTGGIEDFPWAAVHVSARELDAASRATGFRERGATRKAISTACGTGKPTVPAASAGSASTPCASCAA